MQNHVRPYPKGKRRRNDCEIAGVQTTCEKYVEWWKIVQTGQSILRRLTVSDLHEDGKADEGGRRREGGIGWSKAEVEGLKKTRNIYPTEIRHDVKIQIALIIIYFTLPTTPNPIPASTCFPRREKEIFRSSIRKISLLDGSKSLIERKLHCWFRFYLYLEY